MALQQEEKFGTIMKIQRGGSTMIPKDIEELATNAVKKSILTSRFLSQYISENDKEPSWDGFVYIYSREEKTKADFYGKVPVQVKGKYCEDLSRDQIKHSVEIFDLNSYLKDGGVLFFVTYIADGGNKERIYYAPLTAAYIQQLLAASKKTQIKKQIVLTPFPTDPAGRTEVFRRFYREYRGFDGQDPPNAFNQKPCGNGECGVNLLRPYSLIISRYLNRYIYEKIGNLRKKDLYLPNRFSVDSQPLIRDNIMTPVDKFLSGELKTWLKTNSVVLQEQSGQAEEKIERDPDQITTLVIQGEQCTGKSTLAAQIIHRIDTGKFTFRKVYLLSFSERDLQSNSLSCNSICKHLGIRYTDLDDNALLVIDAIDESEWFRQKASMRIADLINEIKDLDCKIIVTSRSGYLDIKMPQVLDFQLRRFSEQQALAWLQLFQQAFPERNTEKLEQYVQNLLTLIRRAEQAEKEADDRAREKPVDERFAAKPLTREEITLLQTAEVVLMPYVMELCILHQVSITSVSSMAQLYTQAFLPETYGNLLHNQYSISPYKVSTEDASRILDAATSISLQCLSRPGNGISREELEKCICDPELTSVVCTKYLLTKSADRYLFVHQSIPAFLTARYVYERFSAPKDQASDEVVLEWLREIVEYRDVLTESVQEYIRYFVQCGVELAKKRVTRMLRRLLNYELCGTVAAGITMAELEARRKIMCDGLVRLYAAFCVQDYDRVIGISFLDRFNAQQRKQLLYLLADPERQASKSMGFCRLQEMELDGLNLAGADLHRRYIHKMRMHGARLCESNLTDGYVVDCDLSLSCLDNAKSKVVQYHNSILCGCSFRNAVLNGAVFTNCNLANADIRGAHVYKTKFENCIMGGMKVSVNQLKMLLYMDHHYIWQHQIQVYLGDELLTGERFLEEYRKVRRIRAISVPNHSF